ncbi:hypothetical protein PJL15_01909 [Paenarthrobacter nitroguajacolicus]|nr:hypothetical protein [Paenarthrobacter nitroguajacolicus]
MFGQFVVCLDYMLSGVPVRHISPKSGSNTAKTSRRHLQAAENWVESGSMRLHSRKAQPGI